MNMLKISEQVFVPIHRVERLSFFGTYALIKYVDQREVDRVDNEDAQRLRMQVDPPPVTADAPRRAGRPRKVR